MGWGRIGVERSGKVNEQVGLKEMSIQAKLLCIFSSTLSGPVSYAL